MRQSNYNNHQRRKKNRLVVVQANKAGKTNIRESERPLSQRIMAFFGTNFKIHFGLFVIYWFGLGKLLFPYCLSAFSPKKNQGIFLSILFATVWFGFVMAILGMEAWLKFRAPFCPRAYKLDIGRTIFPALNSVELALCLACWQQQQLLKNLVTYRPEQSLLLVTLILALDVIWLTPKLVLRGKQVVYRHILKEGGLNMKDSLEFQALDKEMKTQKFEKKDKWHVVYVVLEFIKVIGLGNFILSKIKSTM